MIANVGYRKNILEISSWEIPEPEPNLPVGTTLLRAGTGCASGHSHGRDVGSDVVLFDPIGEMKRFSRKCDM